MTSAVANLDLDALRERSRKDLYFFSKGVLGFDWLTPHIHLPVCLDLQDESSNNKMIIFPRGWLKTTLCSICYPVWRSIRNPNVRILLTQNTHANACKKLSVIRQLWESNPFLRGLFSDLLPGRDSTWKSDALCLSRSASFAEATYEAAGTNTAVVSRHYDCVIEDDTVAPDLDELGSESIAPSYEDVSRAIGWHRTNVLPLLNNPEKDMNLVVLTRWYDEDLAAWIMANEPGFKVLTRAVRENDAGLPDPRGHITYPERFGETALATLESRLGPYMYSCLYMNTPVRAEDMLFKPSWFRLYETTPANLMVYTTVDPATDPELSTSGDVDYGVVMTCGKDMLTGDIYVLDYFREQCNPGEFAAAIFDHVVKYHPIVVGYENVAYQKSLDYWLKELMRQHGVFFVLEQISRGGKSAKSNAIANLQPLFASGSVYFRSWMKDLQSELLKFPLGRHDDLPDALSMQLILWKRTKAKGQKVSYPAHDPLSFENAVEEIKRRKHPGMLASRVCDPLRSLSNAV